MRRISCTFGKMKYMHQLPKWPDFYFDFPKTYWALVDVRHNQGKLLGRMESLGFNLQKQAGLQNLTLDVIKSSEIEGEILNPEQVRSSIARRLGLDIGGFLPENRNVEGIVDMMVDATQNYHEPLTAERLFRWHTWLFPADKYNKMTIGAWRTNAKDDPMQVVSGAMGKETVHFQAPDSDRLEAEMQKFLDWVNSSDPMLDPVIKAAMAHLWFVTIHPFDDGNGRIGRAIADMLLARADGTPYRFYSMSAQIRTERNAYYYTLEGTQSELDITEWLAWFLQCLDRSIANTDNTLAMVLKRKKFWDTFATEPLNERQTKMLSKLLDDFEGKLTSSKWAKITKCSQDTAIRDIQDLITKGILEKEDSGGRSTNYILTA
jgi:Fic family protein